MVTAAVALAVGAAVGFAIGFKVEQSRVKADVKDLRERLAGRIPGGLPVGRVTAVGQGSVTISGATSREISVSGATVIYETTVGTAADIKRGAKIMVLAPARSFDATEIIVLPDDSGFGREVSAVGDDSVTRANPDGTSTEINLTSATVIRTGTVGTAADITQDSTLIARGKSTQAGTFDADEVIVLAADTAFLPTGDGTGS